MRKFCFFALVLFTTPASAASYGFFGWQQSEGKTVLVTVSTNNPQFCRDFQRSGLQALQNPAAMPTRVMAFYDVTKKAPTLGSYPVTCPDESLANAPYPSRYATSVELMMLGTMAVANLSLAGEVSVTAKEQNGIHVEGNIDNASISQDYIGCAAISHGPSLG